MSGSDIEPIVPLPQEAAEQMHDATERLRDLAWMVGPMTAAEILMLVTQLDRFDVELDD